MAGMSAQKRNAIARKNRGKRPGKLIEPKTFAVGTDLARRIDPAAPLTSEPSGERRRVRFAPRANP